jgi:HSP20 family protein
MALGTLVPFDWGTSLPTLRPANDDPFYRLWRQVDRLFDDFMGRVPARGDGGMGFAFPIEVSETNDAYVVRAELPGVEQSDIDISLADNILTIKGEKKVASERSEDGAFMTERAYGQFMRSIRLPYGVDAGQVEAAYKNGVLSITVPKPAELKRNVKRIELKAAA